MGKTRKNLCALFATVALVGGGGGAFGVHALKNGEGEQKDGNTPAQITKTTCAENADKPLFAKRLPQLSENFDRMSQLPLTGKPVYDIVMNPQAHIRSCLVPDKTMDGYAGRYEAGRNLFSVSGSHASDRSMFSHENFHAMQDIHGVDAALTAPILTFNDSVTATLLVEATAEAYAFMTFKEAQKTDPGLTFQTYFTDIDLDKIFDEAYQTAWDQHAAADDKTRTEKAFEAGGKAIVLSFLEGKSELWTKSYEQNSIALVNLEYLKHEQMPGYAEWRRNIYSLTGYVSPRVNITPDVLLGNQAPRKIDKIAEFAAAENPDRGAHGSFSP